MTIEAVAADGKEIQLHTQEAIDGHHIVDGKIEEQIFSNVRYL